MSKRTTRTARRAAARRGSPPRASARRPDGAWTDTGGRPRTRPRPASAPRPRPAKRRGLSSALYFSAAAVLLVVVAVIAIGVMVMHGGGSEPPQQAAVMGQPADNGVSPSAYSDAASSQVFAGIADRKADAAPLTQREVFPKAAKTLPDDDARARLTLADSQLDTDCAVAIWGGGLGEELREGGCTQVARAAYIDKKAGYTALVAIINLATAQDANRVVESMGDNAGFVVPLTKVDAFDEGFSVARGRAMGHYAVVGWVRRLDGKGDAQDEALLSLLVTVEGPKAILNRAASAR
jgi:hypothetical protein